MTALAWCLRCGKEVKDAFCDGRPTYCSLACRRQAKSFRRAMRTGTVDPVTDEVVPHEVTRGDHRYRMLRKKFKRGARRADAPCAICKQPIDYTLQGGEPTAFSLDHIKPWADYPELRCDPSNWQPTHVYCNTLLSRQPDFVTHAAPTGAS